MTRKNKILLYQDYVSVAVGLDTSSVLYKRLLETYGANSVSFCDADDIINGALKSDVFFLVMPGGADLYYAERLNGEGNTKIRAYVEAGGNYLGICAGAYYGSREIDWAKGEIAGSRELAFFDGIATGPVYEFLEENDINKSWKNIVDVTIDNQIYPALYYGGPVFDGQGIATYSSGQNAIVKNTIGKGTVILCSPHIEYTPELLQKSIYKNRNESFEWDNSVIDKFKKRYHKERDIWSRVLKEFE